MSAVDAALVAQRWAELRARIAAAGGRDVRIVAVTKGFGPEAVDAVVAAGCRDIGESYAQELGAKLARVAAERPTVHFVGRLQSNKVRRLAPVVDWWQSVDCADLGGAIARHAPGATVLVQVNVTGEPQKGGCDPADAARLVDALGYCGLRVAGLMAVGRAGDPSATRAGFRRLRRLVDDLGLAECSMGMSADLEIAVSEGSTMVRVGEALFGARPPRQGREK